MLALTLTLTLKQHYNKKKKGDFNPDLCPAFYWHQYKALLFPWVSNWVSTIVRKLQPARPLGSLFRRSDGRTCLFFFFLCGKLPLVSWTLSCKHSWKNMKRQTDPYRQGDEKTTIPLPINGGMYAHTWRTHHNTWSLHDSSKQKFKDGGQIRGV